MFKIIILGASYCRRRAIFSERAYSYKPINRYFIVGILVHELLEKVLKEKSYSYNEIENIAKNLMSKNTTVIFYIICTFFSNN